MRENKIFVACDSTNISKIKKIIKETQNSKIKVGYKFGLEFLNSKNGTLTVTSIEKNIAKKEKWETLSDIKKQIYKLQKYMRHTK